MRVLYITQATRSAFDGFAKVSFEMADELAKTEEVAILYPAKKYSKIINPSGLIEYTVESEDVKSIGFTRLNKTHKEEILSILNEFSPDIIHTHILLESALSAQKWASEHGVPFLVTLHFSPLDVSAWLGLGNVSDISQRFVSKATKSYLSNILKVSDGVIVQNHQILNELKQLEYPGKSCVIPNGRQLSNYNQVNIPELINDADINLIFVGSMLTRKNQLYLLNVMKHLPDRYKLHLVGEEKDTIYSDKLKKYIKKNKLSAQVVMHGSVDSDKISKILSQSHFFISASVRESFSLAVLETLASGTPFIGLGYAGLDMLVNDENGLVLTKDVSSKVFAQKMQDYIGSYTDQSYQRLCKITRMSVNHYDWSDVIGQTKDFYRKFSKYSNNDSNHKKRPTVVKFVVAITIILSGMMYLGSKIFNKFKSNKND